MPSQAPPSSNPIPGIITGAFPTLFRQALHAAPSPAEMQDIATADHDCPGIHEPTEAEVPADFLEPIVHRTPLAILTDSFRRHEALKPYLFLNKDGSALACEHNKAIYEIYDLGVAAGKAAQ